MQLPPTRIDPSRDRVDVWWCSPAEVASPEAAARCERLLCDEERAERDRYQFEEHRHEYTVTHALARTALSLYADVAPEAWRFERTEHGRPEICGPGDAPALRFSLSNTGGVVACGVTLGQEVGVDVEDTTRPVELLELAERFFSPHEARELARAEPGRRRDRFFDYWTLKEAYVKARGLGLSIPLEQFAFSLDDAGKIRIAFDAGIDDDDRAWQFARLRLRTRFALAVGVRRGHRPDVDVRVSHLLPLPARAARDGRAERGRS